MDSKAVIYALKKKHIGGIGTLAVPSPLCCCMCGSHEKGRKQALSHSPFLFKVKEQVEGHVMPKISPTLNCYLIPFSQGWTRTRRRKNSSTATFPKTW